MILIVDDEEELLKLLELRLKKNGHEVIKAKNGKEAIELAKKEKPELITMDIMMPVMDGFKAIELIKLNPETSGIPIIVLTALADKPSEDKSKELGAEGFVKKPFDSEALIEKIRALLKK